MAPLRTGAAALAILVLAALAPAATAPNGNSSVNSPTGLQLSYLSAANAVTLSWQPTNSGNAQFSYMVWRDGTYVGTTNTTSFTDPLAVARDAGYVYYVSTVRQETDGLTVSAPAIGGVSTLACEVVTVSTSWSWPYVSARLHEECVSIPYDKDTTWSRP